MRVGAGLRRKGMSAARIALLLFCLAAGTAQSWIAQLHFHPASQAEVCVGTDCPPGEFGHPAGQVLPGDISCLLCQIAMHGGIALAAGTVEPALAPARALEPVLPSRVALPSGNASHHWSSRGPPRA